MRLNHYTLRNGSSSIVADASVQSLDQPGILSFKTTEEECVYSGSRNTSEVQTDEEATIQELIVN